MYMGKIIYGVLLLLVVGAGRLCAGQNEWENPEKETPVYFLDTILDELIFYCGPEEVRRRLDELTCRN